MGRRSRKRGSGSGMAAPERPSPRPPRGTFGDRFLAAADERPKPPWHPFPLVELCVLAGLILIVWGFVDFEDRQGRILLAMGLVLASLGGMDTALRDHLGGVRSHTLLLASLPAVIAAGVLYFTGAPWPLVFALPLLAFAAGFRQWRRVFRRRTGGVSFRA